MASLLVSKVQREKQCAPFRAKVSSRDSMGVSPARRKSGQVRLFTIWYGLSVLAMSPIYGFWDRESG